MKLAGHLNRTQLNTPLIRYAIIILAVVLLAGCVSGPRVGFAPGDTAPNFILNSVNGERVSLSDYRGSVVLVNFWAPWCQPCISEMPSMQRVYSQLQGKGFVILAVGIDDSIEKFKSFKEQLGLSFPVLVDETGEVKRLFRVTGVPESFIISRSGKFVSIADLDDNLPVVRVVGPRSWDTPNAQARLNGILSR